MLLLWEHVFGSQAHNDPGKPLYVAHGSHYGTALLFVGHDALYVGHPIFDCETDRVQIIGSHGDDVADALGQLDVSNIHLVSSALAEMYYLDELVRSYLDTSAIFVPPK